MPFINEILKYKTLSIVGIEKNTGKTECLNYILKRLPQSGDGERICVTSIGIDGERVDQVTDTAKPEIMIREGMLFATAQRYYNSRRLVSQVLDIYDESTALGRIITASAVSSGKVILAGPSSTSSLKRWMDSLDYVSGGVDRIIIDGALSRLSPASPAVSEAMILSTGAAYSANLPTLVKKTGFVVEMMNLPMIGEIQEDCVDISSLNTVSIEISDTCRAVMVKGILTDRFLKQMIGNKRIAQVDVVVGDFTKIFITPSVYRAFLKSGGRLKVRQKSKLIAICVNPIAPNGYVMDSDRLCAELSREVNLPVYDIVKNKYEA